MNLKDLENKNLIVAHQAPKEQIEKEIALAERDVNVAKKIIKENYDWALAIAYNAVLQAGRAFMLSKGYRPRGEQQHKTVLKYLEIVLGKDFKENLDFLDTIRIKRHRAIYDEPELISESEANFAIQIAEEFLEDVKGRIK
jgi:uncharacterized protein (UPF0332 family)